ncbi:two-component system chemotaxis sensor kinase CheA [Clostridium tetanomorphum]|uniref:Chemotaxis protein CheA n=1 Tax=Clostridium tetanomorphum TaxID=1553 RepID=A0A923ED67_CLOTT|nr:chemotaxis protein CheA [Clostridium tetanomorphum]KAJ53490.1 chemotaxis protein CheA [Clostridium tetanomorphum DSM 665]MBC2398435.1 chemotaxis protein CheA [Clostridium tetanomorphum]MBP1865277.1 two-component system chemotaxis sensor kinase CheA [Clostridium tetanomorphum]NRS85200.1 two-component system chemotaxis sensor kinase CheA [Clostridium tetanomorphum]NRZ98379.1 two-component system chemotaxis sensor kinase CheA [Clostridium tetanomorphum]
MDTSQYMSMFLEESMDNLQILNESLLQLEQEPDDVDKLNEIFRVAHTIKGMAATMGFNQMAELTHKMEDVLSEFRDGELKVTQKVVTVLFKCLDTLEQMVNNISDGVEEEVPIEHIMKELEAVSEGEEVEETEADVPEEKEIINSGELDTIQAMDLNEYDINVVQQASDKGFSPYHVKVVLSENTLLKSARAFLIFKNLEDMGEIIKSIPTTEDIENENFDFEINLIYLSTKNKEEIYNILINISEVDEVMVDNVNVKAERAKKVEDEEKKAAEVKAKIIEQQKEEASKDQSPKKQDKKVENKPKENKNGNREKEVAHRKQHQSVRVDLERLDKFMNMVSELVIHRTRLEQISLNYRLTELNETLEQVARTTSDLQDLVMKIRMLPLDVVFNRFPRMVRDLSVELNKEMELIIQGQDTELDRTVIDEIGEPLIHLIRNAADHGVEPKEERIKKGKNPVGKIRLIAYQEGTKAVIKVEDDGSGIPVDKVKAKAERIGISTEGMSDNDIRNLIFMQGFSTNEQVTDISGRGVGMDVVKTKIASLGGNVEVVSEKDKGSSFIIRLPLTLQIIQALLVKVGNETMAISLGYIDRVIDFEETLVKRTNNKEVIIYNGTVIPLVRLNKKLNLQESDNTKQYIVIVKVGEKNVGLMVDSLLGQQEIVIKPLGKTLQGMKEYIGATILGDGLVTLILDVAALV